MCWFYILKNEETSRYYIGSTNNLKERLKQHKRGHTRTTRILKTYKLVYWEKFDKIENARERERQIKSYKSKKYIEWLISWVHSSTGRAVPMAEYHRDLLGVRFKDVLRLYFTKRY